MTKHTQARLDALIHQVLDWAGEEICVYCIRRELRRRVRAERLPAESWDLKARLAAIWFEATGRDIPPEIEGHVH